MDFNEIDKLINTLKKNLEVIENNGVVEPETKIDALNFNKNVEEIKKRLYSTTDEGSFFKNVFNTEDYYENISSYLEQTNKSLYYKIEKAGVSLKTNQNLQESLTSISNIMQILVAEYQIQNKKKKKSIFSRSGDTAMIRGLLAELMELQNRMNKILHLDSQIVSNVVLENFKTIYTFFYNCIRVAKQRGDELLLVEIAGITDRIIEMIRPVLSGKSLKTNELIYHYLRATRAKSLRHRRGSSLKFYPLSLLPHLAKGYLLELCCFCLDQSSRSFL